MPHSSLCQSQTQSHHTLHHHAHCFSQSAQPYLCKTNFHPHTPTGTTLYKSENKKKTIIKGGGAANRGIISGRSCKQRDHSQRGENKKIQSKNGGIRGGNSDNKWAVESTSVYSINSLWLTTQLQAHHPSPRLNHSPKLAAKRIPRRNHPKSR